MNYIILKENVIENMIVAEPEVAEAMGALPFYDGASIGAVYAPPLPPPTTEEQLRADVDYIAVMTGVSL